MCPCNPTNQVSHVHCIRHGYIVSYWGLKLKAPNMFGAKLFPLCIVLILYFLACSEFRVQKLGSNFKFWNWLWVFIQIQEQGFRLFLSSISLFPKGSPELQLSNLNHHVVSSPCSSPSSYSQFTNKIVVFKANVFWASKRFGWRKSYFFWGICIFLNRDYCW